MANTQIPNLPAVASVSGADLVEAVQSGVSVKESIDQIATYVLTKYPYPLPSVVLSWSGGTTGLTPAVATQGNVVMSGTLNAVNGGTGQAVYAVGDILFASTTTALSRLADIAAGNVLLSGGVNTAPSYGKVSLTAAVTGTLPIGNGGTGQTTAAAAFNALSPITTAGDLILGTGVNTAGRLAIGGNNTALLSNGTTASWGQVSLTAGVTGTLPAINGGTGLALYAVGDIVFANTTTTLARLADVATGSVLLSGGLNTAPSWGQVSLTTAVTGTLPAVNGGTGLALYAVGDLLFANTTTTLARLADVATGSVLISGGLNTAPAWGQVSLTTAVSGVLPVANGGIGVGTLTGIPLGNGTSPFTVAAAGTDYAKPTTASTWTAKQTFNGTTAIFSMNVLNAVEPITISATAATGTINYDTTTQSVLYYTTNAAANWTLNFRASAGTTMNAAMATGESITVVFAVTQGASPFFNNVVQVDGTAVGVTTKWQGLAPAAGNASGIDVYTYVIVKTGSATFTIFASQTQFV